MKSKRPTVRGRGSPPGKKRGPADRKRTLLYWLGWALLIAALFYALHRYFEHREQQLDERLEQLSSTRSVFHLQEI